MNGAPTALFDSYEQDFHQFIQAINKKLEGEDNEDRKAVLRRVDMELDEADEMVSQMEIEIQGMSPSVRMGYNTRLRTAKADLARHKKLLKEQEALATREDLFSSSSQPFTTSDDPYNVTSDRARLLAKTSQLEDGTRRLQESQRIALETENQGADILMNLRSQREQIENAQIECCGFFDRPRSKYLEKHDKTDVQATRYYGFYHIYSSSPYWSNYMEQSFLNFLNLAL